MIGYNGGELAMPRTGQRMPSLLGHRSCQRVTSVRTAIWYLISLSFHGAALAAIAMIPPLHGTLRGGNGGSGGNPAAGSPVVEGSFLGTAQGLRLPVLRLRIEPAPATGRVAAMPPAGCEPKKVSPEIGLRRPAAKTEDLPRLTAPPSLPRAMVSHVALEQLTEMPVLPKRAASQAALLGGADGGQGGTPSGGAIAGGDGGTPGRGLPGPFGDGRLGGPGGSGADQTPSASAWNPPPTYPADALTRGAEGLVLLRVWIRDDGAVQAVRIHRSSGDALLDESALSTVRDRWQFVPARRNGVNVPWDGLLPIRFRLRAG
jgi:periplasmic protein TonB